MDDLLKEAIADAKAVRETALENAKIALEEAFTPRLQSMLAKKIQSEIEEEGEDWEDEEDEVAPEAPEEGHYEDDEDPSDEFSAEPEMDMGEPEPEMDMGEPEMDMDDEEEMPEGVIEINGVKYAPVVAEEDEEGEEEEEFGESDDLDLEAVLRELEADDENLDEQEVPGEEDEVDDMIHAQVDGDSTEKSSEIGAADNKVDLQAGVDDGGHGSEEPSDADVPAPGKENDEDEVKESFETEEEIDLEEIIKALSEEEDEEEEVEEVSKLKSDLDEHRNVVKYLRSKLNEVNLLNAKLLFTNKLFRSYGLNNDQKMKVVETFDRAHNLREVKLVYSTLAESFGSNNNKTEIKENKKGSASKAVASTKSEKQEVIAEGHEMRDRFKKLAGIL